ncbi:MAG: exodeoxyribonuclease III [Gammaproteobacteria bacterium]|nr:exodeoxyribonuclease III [Gammaproteobacteria bacterium]
MRIVSANLNGIRAAARKGFFDWMIEHSPDVVCIQETKAQEYQLDDEVFSPPGYYRYFFDAQKKGYSGTAIYSRVEPDKINVGLGWEHVDNEGRWIEAQFGKLNIISLYLPSGSSSEERHANKLIFMDRLREEMKSMRRKRREFIICGDWNTVHKRIDIKNFTSNRKNSGCTDEERAWMDAVFEKDGWVDAFREVNQEADQYTWWSNRGQAWAKNVGWRIDYQIVTPGLKELVKAAQIYRDDRFSDHAPLTIDYDYKL